MYDLLKKSFLDGPVVERNGYPYFVNPICDGIPRVEPSLLKEVTEGMMAVGNFDCDMILAPEAMGIHLAAPISLELGIPFSIIRKHSYGLPGEIEVGRKTGYSSDFLYINGPKKGDRVVLLDDTLSTGGTAKAIACALSSRGIDLVEFITVFDKAGHVEDPVPGVRTKSLLRVCIKDGRPALDC